MMGGILRQGAIVARAGVSRRAFLAGVVAATSSASLRANGAPLFDFETVVEAAMDLARRDHVPSSQSLRAPFSDLDYDDYRAIRLRPERRLWQGQGRGFTADMTPPGFLYGDRVALAEIDGATVRPVPFDADALTFDPGWFENAGQLPGTGASDGHDWTGFRLQHPLNTPGVMDELAVFQGASYFRAVAQGLSYGLSARGLAIGTGSGRPEEFPAFTRFWLQKPEPDAVSMTVFALLDSPSIAGAYAFTIRPGRETVMDVKAVLAPRRSVEDVGVAPLTSMHWFSALDRRHADDHRSAVHDSDGLAMLNGRGERLWRPLTNPATLQISAFADFDPSGFGLVQRERAFEGYNDPEARYERRPSAWVEPRGAWGSGAVVLVELPTENEFHDNIVAFWRPDAPLVAGGSHRFDYRLTWAPLPPGGDALAQVTATRSGRDVNTPASRTFAIDLDLRDASPEGLTVAASASAGVVEDVRLLALPIAGRIRAALLFTPPADGVAELRLRLTDAAGAPASETWLYRWTPS